MNDPNKTINVNLSSLLSLKAELLRKQAEVSKAKATRSSAEEYSANKNNNSGSINNNTTSKRKDKEETIKKVSANNEATIYEHEDSALLEKSQRVLAAKSKFYDRMSRAGGKLNSDDNCLVLFNRKRQEETDSNYDELQPKVSSSEDSSCGSSDEVEGADDHEEDWVDYTDCLGRTRKCLRRDLEDVKRRDTELANSMPERLDQSKANWMIDTKGNCESEQKEENETLIGPLPTESIYSDGCSLVSKHDEQRANWERKEHENLDKKDVHYQDVFFDEARQHGVGYYAFSTDEEKRKRQQQELEEARQQTVNEQEHRDRLRAQREKIIAERVLAAKNRQRARLGLPPLEEAENLAEANDEKQKETKEQRKERKRAEKLKQKQEKLERERELERQQHVRPWDKEKDGMHKSCSTNESDSSKETEWIYKPERLPMSQEEWNEHKREERKAEFAPVSEPTTVHMNRTNFTSMPPPRPPPMTATAAAGYGMMAPPLSLHTFVPFQSTKREKQSFQRRSYTAPNEIGDDDSYEGHSSVSRGAAIPPPTDLDARVNRPPPAKKSKSSIELERSIEAGLRFLRDNCDKDALTTKSSWTAKADY